MMKYKRPIRSYHGIVFRTNTTNKKYLAKDFDHRCGYCDDLDVYGGGYRAYQVEHFAPFSKFEKLEFDYDNLLYACPWCNRAKWDIWPSDDSTVNVVGNNGFIDPCNEEYELHLTRAKDGSIQSMTPLGEYMRMTLHLHLKRHEIVHNVDKLKTKLDDLRMIIAADKNAGKECSKKEKLLCAIEADFFQYFNLWIELSQRIA